jgi:tetratricopeptide (TPR) repeat protein
MTDAAHSQLLRAYELQTQGRLHEAERGYRQVLAADGENVHALNLLGIICLHSGRAQDAASLIERALAIDASDADPHANLGLALRALGRLDDAAKAIQRSVQIDPHNPVTLNNLGNVLAELQRNDEAVASFRAALRLDDRYVDALINLSAALLSKDQTDGALAAAARAVELAPQNAASHVALGEALLKLTRHEAASECFQKALVWDTTGADARIGLSAAVKELGDEVRAEALLREVISAHPGHALAFNSLGVLLEQRGDATAAAAAFRSAIAANPRFANAYYQLAQLKGSRLTADEVTAVQALYHEPGLHDDLRAPLAFALACVYERAGDFETSFRCLAEAQFIKARARPYDDAKVADYHQRILQAVPPGRARASSLVPAQWPQPVFVLGMPRSGTSLTEQILSSHPQVAGAGELSLMEDTINEAARIGARPFPECVPLLSGAQLNDLGRFYLDRLVRRATAERYVVDKTPMNFQYVGFIAAILPGARIVHCRREPMDNCLSIFKLPFEAAHTYAHDLQALGRYYRHYSSLMLHWAGVVGPRMITLQYEDLVADLPAQTARLTAFLGLEPDERMLEFHKTERLVKTPSASQVRQPIYRDSVQAWRRYGEALWPLAEALGITPISRT